MTEEIELFSLSTIYGSDQTSVAGLGTLMLIVISFGAVRKNGAVFVMLTYTLNWYGF